MLIFVGNNKSKAIATIRQPKIFLPYNNKIIAKTNKNTSNIFKVLINTNNKNPQ